jgi:hypothetical protein
MRLSAELLKFVKKARDMGYSDGEIRKSLLSHGWNNITIDLTYKKLEPKIEFKNQVTLFLDSGMIKILKKRAKKNLFSLNEQIEDILRRSCARGSKKKIRFKKPDDRLISCFARQNKGRKRKK